MWIYGTGNVRLWANTLHVLVEALLGKQLENDGSCQWIKERWNVVAEIAGQQGLHSHAGTPQSTRKSQIKYIPCSFAECDFC
jgi:hypothetical protein